jgi:hypothetical protein
MSPAKKIPVVENTICGELSEKEMGYLRFISFYFEASYLH